MFGRLVAAIAACVLAGCATMRDTTTQPVLIGSRPPGATIYRDGEAVGQTPMFVDVSRRGRPHLTVASAGGPVPITLDKRYRWRDSFWPNWVFWVGAPIGWATDLLSGAAYAYRPADFPKVTLTATDRRALTARPEVVVIAPPASDEPTLSDAAGKELEDSLRAGKHRTVRPYRDTLPTFLAHGYDFDGGTPEADRGPLYQRLDADVVYESKIERRGDHLTLKSRANHVLTRETTAVPDIELDGQSDLDRLLTSRSWWSVLLPNLIGLDFAATRVTLSHEGQPFRLKPPENENFLARSLEYLSAIKISSLPARRLERSLRWRLSFIPTIRASRRTVVSPEVPTGLAAQDIDTRYTRSLIGIGYGPEFGVQSGRNYVYLDLLPLLFYSRIDSAERTVSGTNVQLGVELGYIYYFSSRWNARLFSRSQNEDAGVWQAALGDRLGPNQQTTTVTSFVSGLSIGYRFEPSARARRH